jgi:hydrogenase nickel incorporation protein HypA/HybF
VHELAITESVVAAVAERTGDARVTRVVLEVGCLSGVVPDSVAFCFDLCTQGTTLEGATLDIVSVPAHGRCLACAAELEVRDPLACCACGGVPHDLTGGQELRIKEVEVI